jgi:hypothetical protein
MTAAPTAPPPQAAPTPDAAPSAEETGRQVVKRLSAMAVHGRPRAAVAAFEALVALDQYLPCARGRMIELSRTGRPRVAAAAAKALVRATRAERLYRDGRRHYL